MSMKKINIGTALVSLLFAVAGAVIAYRFVDYPLTYTDFIAGSLAWGDEGKSKDVSLVFAFIAIFSLSIVSLAQFQEWIYRKYNKKVAEYFSITLMYASIPFIMCIGEQVLSKNMPSDQLLRFNTWLVLGGLIATFLVLRGGSQLYKNNEASKLIVFSFVIFAFSILSPDVLGAIATRFGRGEGALRDLLKNALYIIPTVWLVFLYIFKDKGRYYKYSVIFFQTVIIGYFVLLLPSPYITEGQLSFFRTQTLLYVLVSILVVYSIYDIYRRYKLTENINELSFSLLSPFPFAALFVLTFLSATSMPYVSADDYHYGEKLLPFYMIVKYHIVPYSDYALAHGFVDLIPAVGSSLFFDGTASTLDEGGRILTALLAIISFLTAYRYVGLLTAVLLSVLLMGALTIPNGIWYFIAASVSLIIMNIKVERLGVAFFLVSLIIFLLAPGQGAVFILAILPLVLYRAWNSKAILVNLKAAGISFVVLALSGLLMPWVLGMMLSAVRYVLENGPVNFQAYGVAWHHSWNASQTINSSLAIYEVIRTSWIFAPLFILSLWLLGCYKGKKEAFAYSFFALVFVLIMHKYSLGRIDPFGLSRLGIVSIASIPLLFLSVYFLNLSKRKNAYLALLFVFWIGLLTPNYLYSPVEQAKRGIPNIGTLTTGEEIGIPKLGNGITNAAHINRTLAIKKIADQFLDDNETFVDVTNRGGLYFYLDRRMPIEAVPYNQPHSSMQQRSVDKLQKKPPPMALLKADNINHDGRSVSIRTYRIYRWVMDNYIPIAMGSFIIGVHKNKLDLFQKRFPNVAFSKESEDTMLLWDKVFLLKDLQQLPISWGNSQKTLNDRVSNIKGINFAATGFNDAIAIDSEKYQVTGNDPFIVYDISQQFISGSGAGILSFDFSCDRRNAKPRIQVFWSADDYGITEKTSVYFNAHNGHVILPLDVAPRWLSTKHIKNIRMDLVDKNACQIFAIKNLSLGQRILDDK